MPESQITARRGTSSTTFTNSTAARPLRARVTDLWRYRELLANLVRRELKVKYKNSVLGFLWTLLNPLLYLAVFSLVFSGFLRGGVQFYGIFLLSGLLAWNLLSTGLTGATASIVANGPLVQKVWFPREILPLAAVGAALINFTFQLIVLAGALAVFRWPPDWGLLWLVPIAVVVTVVWAAGLGLLLSASNVYLRDVQHFLELGLLAWFWLTPIVYQYDLVASALIGRWGPGAERLTLLNPMIPVVVALQKSVYDPSNLTNPEEIARFALLDRPGTWFLQNLMVSGAAGLVVLLLGVWVFGRLEANMGEEV